ncbi:MAG TPA: septal ring lytic transglycosylase RlpA family protein [Geobacteraceae bacterium]|nr:septal ring lytic transglycosylase RlpA family protein [Geobacteraceae bacterium]
MAFMRTGNRLALIMSLSLLTLPLNTTPLQAQETAIPIKSPEEKTPAGESAAGEEGTASYYARHYRGRKTHSGKRYDPKKMTAASPDLPLGCRVRVVNLVNGKEVVVTVNDRCRRKKAPFIDLSRGAAGKLGILGMGIAKVRIIPMDDEDESMMASQKVVIP